MNLQESGEMYLETIHILLQTKGVVRAVDVGEKMGVSKPSVSRAIGLLKDGGYVASDGEGHLSLTEEGERIAGKIYEKHVLLSQFLMSLGVSEENAVKDACKMEHDISEETFEAIKRQLNK